MGVSNIDLIYAAAGIIFGIILMTNPRAVMRGAKYDEESIKTESFVKKFGAALTILALIFGIYILVK